MKVTAAVAIGLACLFLPPAQRQGSAAGPPHVSATDRQVAARAGTLARRNPRKVPSWLTRQRIVRQVEVGTDGRTLLIHFRDGARLAVLAPLAGVSRVPLPLHPHSGASPLPMRTQHARAIVLEPFADQLQGGEAAGQAEADTLEGAGFQVNILRNGEVTVDALGSLPDYTLLYVETHAGALPDGDAVVLTRDTDASRYAALFADGSLYQAIVAGDPGGTLYLAFTGTFVARHLGNFPNHSLVFINGCGVLAQPVFWHALEAKGVETLIGWDDEVDSTLSDPAANAVLGAMGAGQDVGGAVADAHRAGVGDSLIEGRPASLGYRGDGGDSFRRMQGAMDEPVTPTATPTPTGVMLLREVAREVWRPFRLCHGAQHHTIACRP